MNSCQTRRSPTRRCSAYGAWTGRHPAMHQPTEVTLIERGSWHQNVEQLAGMFIAGFKSIDTRHAYKHDLKRWFEFADRYNFDPLEAHRTHAELYLRSLEASGLANATCGRRISTVGSFYDFLVREEVLEHSPVAHVRRPKRPEDVQRSWLTRPQLHDWLDAAEELGGYDYPLACLLGLNGLRIGEVCKANVPDLGEDRWHHTLRIIGKGDETAMIPLPPRTRLAIDQALDGRETGPLILTQAGTRMNRGAGARAVQRIAKAAGIKKHITPHSLRRSAITAGLSAGVSLRDMQLFARHKNPSTTIRYDMLRQSLDQHPAYNVAQYVAGAA